MIALSKTDVIYFMQFLQRTDVNDSRFFDLDNCKHTF